MQYLFGILTFLTSLFLILLILIQRGRGGGLAGALGGMGGQSAFGTKAGDLFTRVTIGVAAFWIVLSIATIKILNSSQDSKFGTANRSSSAGSSGAGADKDQKDKDQKGTVDPTVGAGLSSGIGKEAPATDSTKAEAGGAPSPSTTSAPPAASPATPAASPAAPASAPASPPAASPAAEDKK